MDPGSPVPRSDSGIGVGKLARSFLALLTPELLFRTLVTCSGYLLLGTVALIFIFVVSQTTPLFEHTSLLDYLTGTRWLPVSTPQVFGIVPFLVGSAMVVSVALAVGVPLGVAVAVYLVERASPAARQLARPVLGTLAGIPSVVYGIIGLLVVAPWVQRALNLPTGLTGLTAGLVLGLMIVPTVASLSEESLLAVPGDYREAALALGASPFQAFWTVVVPAAYSGLTAAILLATGRALGETMTVLIVGGGRLTVPGSLLVPMRTMTATLAAEINNAAQFGNQYAALFGLGAVLFVLTLIITVACDLVLARAKRGVGRT